MANRKHLLLASATATALFAASTAAADSHKDGEKKGRMNDHEKVYLTSASDIIGMDLETNDGREAGEIEYLLIDSTSGAVRYALIEEDDDLELEDDQLVALPFSVLNVRDADSDEIEADVSLAELAGAFKVDEDKIEEFAEPAVITRVYDYFDIPDDDRIAGNSGDMDDDSSMQNQNNDGENKDGLPHLLLTRATVTTVVPGLSTADRILGSDVRALADEDLGEIEELVMDADSGKIAYVLVGQGGFLGIGEDYAAIPLQSLTWNAEDETYVVANGPDKRFRKLSKSQLPTSVNRSHLDDFYKSYKLTYSTSN